MADTEKWAAAMTRFITSLLGKRKRRIPILYRWNGRISPVKSDSLEEIISTQLITFLYKPLQVEMTNEALYPWGQGAGAGFAIPWTWLLPHELDTVKMLYSMRTLLWHVVRQPPHWGQSFSLTEYNPPQPVFREQHRRELVRDLVGLCWIQKDPQRRAALYYAWLQSVQRAIVSESATAVDLFLIPLVRLLNGDCRWDNLLAIE